MFLVTIGLLVTYCFISLESTSIRLPDRAVTLCGEECATDECTMRWSGYRMCSLTRSGKHSKPLVQYCSLPGQTIRGELCENSCQKWGRTAYFWCQTGDSWDYCSPSKASGNAGDCTSNVWWIILGIVCGIVVLAVACVVVSWKLSSLKKNADARMGVEGGLRSK